MVNLAHKNLVPNPKKDIVIGEHSIHCDYEGNFSLEVIREYWNDDSKDPECGQYILKVSSNSQSLSSVISINNFSPDDLFALSKALHKAGNYIKNKEME